MVNRDIRDGPTQYSADSGTSPALDTSGALAFLQKCGVVPKLDEGDVKIPKDPGYLDERFYLSSIPRIAVLGGGYNGGDTIFEYGDRPSDGRGSRREIAEQALAEAGELFEAEQEETDLWQRVHAEYGKLAAWYGLNIEIAYNILDGFGELTLEVMNDEQRDAIAQVYAVVATYFRQNEDLSHMVEYGEFLERMGADAYSFSIVQDMVFGEEELQYHGEFAEFVNVLARKAEELFRIDNIQDDIPYGFQEDLGLVLSYDPDTILEQDGDDVVALDG